MNKVDSQGRQKPKGTIPSSPGEIGTAPCQRISHFQTALTSRYQKAMRLGNFRRNIRSDPLRASAAGRIVPRAMPLGRSLVSARAVPPHKQGRDLTPAQLRIEMIELAITGNRAFSVCRYETDRGGVNYTVETLAHFRQQDADRELFFLLGADMLRDLPHWRHPEQICELATLVAVRRAGEPSLDFDCLREIASREQIEQIEKHQVEMPAIEISATDVRHRAAAGLSFRYRTPRAVEKYIETHGLYRV